MPSWLVLDEEEPTYLEAWILYCRKRLHRRISCVTARCCYSSIALGLKTKCPPRQKLYVNSVDCATNQAMRSIFLSHYCRFVIAAVKFSSVACSWPFGFTVFDGGWMAVLKAGRTRGLQSSIYHGWPSKKLDEREGFRLCFLPMAISICDDGGCWRLFSLPAKIVQIFHRS